jgi:hypothetical protein
VKCLLKQALGPWRKPNVALRESHGRDTVWWSSNASDELLLEITNLACRIEEEQFMASKKAREREREVVELVREGSTHL